METASAPRANALATSAPERMPPETTSCTSSATPIAREGLGRHAHGRQRGDAGVLDEHVLGGGGAALHAVDHHDVGAGGHGQLHVVVDAGGADLDVDRDRPVGGLAELLDLDAQVVGADPVGVPAGRALVDARRERRAWPPPGRSTFWPSSRPPPRAWRPGRPRSRRRRPGAGRPGRSRSATAGPGRRAATTPCAPRASCRRHPSWSTCRPRWRRGRGPPWRGRQGAEAHAGDGDGDLEVERPGAVAGAEHGPRRRSARGSPRAGSARPTR